jgi:hypothetical protein
VEKFTEKIFFQAEKHYLCKIEKIAFL